MVRLRDSWPFSLSSAPTVGNPCRPLQPESVSARMKGLLTFHRRKRILYFRKGERGSIERKLKYQSYEKEATRHVVKAGGKAKSGKGPAYYRHAALLPNFVELRGDWYLAIEPTYHFTHDGSQDYAFE